MGAEGEAEGGRGEAEGREEAGGREEGGGKGGRRGEERKMRGEEEGGRGNGGGKGGRKGVKEKGGGGAEGGCKCHYCIPAGGETKPESCVSQNSRKLGSSQLTDFLILVLLWC